MMFFPEEKGDRRRNLQLQHFLKCLHVHKMCKQCNRYNTVHCRCKTAGHNHLEAHGMFTPSLPTEGMRTEAHDYQIQVNVTCARTTELSFPQVRVTPGSYNQAGLISLFVILYFFPVYLFSNSSFLLSHSQRRCG